MINPIESAKVLLATACFTIAISMVWTTLISWLALKISRKCSPKCGVFGFYVCKGCNK